MNNVLIRFKRYQGWARRLLADHRGVEIDKIDWPIGCIHDLRDTYLMGIKAQGVPLDIASRMAGHANISTTVKHYLSATDRDADTVRDAVSRSGLAGAHAQDTNRTHESSASA